MRAKQGYQQTPMGGGAGAVEQLVFGPHDFPIYVLINFLPHPCKTTIFSQSGAPNPS